MEYRKPYATRAAEIISSINTAELIQSGITRDHRYDFIVQYPPPLTFRQLSGADLYT
jgi:hypothetical protein